MSSRNSRRARSSLEQSVGARSECFAEAVQLLLARIARHRPLLQQAAELDTSLAGSAKAALSKMAGRLVPSEDAVDPAQFLLALQTYYALVVKGVTRDALESSKASDKVSHGPLSQEEIQRFEEGRWAADLGVVGFPDSPRWAWYLNAWDEPLEHWRRSLRNRLHELTPITPETDPAEGHDLFGSFYMSLLPKQVRHALGEHYTPAWLADLVLDRIGYDGTSGGRLLDPTCGSGTFLLRAMARLKKARGEGGPASEGVPTVAGMDVNDLAVLTARANYLLAIRDRLNPDRPTTLPVHLRDVVLEEESEPAYDFLVGNPPWLAWDHLPNNYRRQTMALWQRYGLFTLSGNEARHGGGKKDLAMLVLYAGADRYLRPGGRLGMVVTQTLLQTRGAGDGFRQFRLGEEGPPLKVLHVDDLVDVQPFDTAANWTAVLALEKGSPTRYPVPYVRWTRSPEKSDASATCGRPSLASQRLEAVPIDPERLQSPWLVRPAGLGVPLEQLCRPSDYTAHLGANTGGANGVYWLNLLGRVEGKIQVENLPGRGKQPLPAVLASLEPELLYPLVRWSDVGRFRAEPSAFLLLVQDPATRRGIDELRLKNDFPRTFAYLKQFEELLRRRAAYRRYQDSAPFYSMYNVGEYTVASHKVVWRRMDRAVRAAVLAPVEVPLLGLRPVLCQETCAMIATESAEESHYLAAVLNSSLLGFLVQAHNVRGGKGFGSPGMVEYLGIRRFDGQNPVHCDLADLGLAASKTVASEEELGRLETAIDEKTAVLYGIEAAQVALLADFVEKSN